MRKTIPQIENTSDRNKIIDFRINWLNNFLENINSKNILKENKDLIEEYFSNRNYEKNYTIEFILKCISYLCFKENYP